MKVASLVAEGVHGYLSINITFFPDLTFVTGVNGSGKTSALRLLMGLLTPQVEDLARISFRSAAATIADQGIDTVIRAVKPETGGLRITITGVEEELELSSADMAIMAAAHRRDDARPVVQAKLMEHAVVRRIEKISTPMFLGLDRRFYYADVRRFEDLPEIRRREMVMRRLVTHEADDPNTASGTSGLGEVNLLVSETMADIRSKQEQLDSELRNKILVGAFRYAPRGTGAVLPPSRQTLEKYREREAMVERAAPGLQLPLSEVQSALSKFFESMNAVVSELEAARPKLDPKSRKGKKVKEAILDPADSKVVEWFMNAPQADRIFDTLGLLEQYSSDRSALHEPIEKFLNLVNGFLVQTGKRAEVSPRGSLRVVLTSGGEDRTINSLSSGERQIVVMLANLSLNPLLKGSGVFIVDEPELSLHMAWQERFVDAILEANPKVQLIMATHSPAIILDRDDRQRGLNEEGAS